VAAEEAAAGVGRLLQEPDRRRLHLPAVLILSCLREGEPAR
jgi:hypothetical protein